MYEFSIFHVIKEIINKNLCIISYISHSSRLSLNIFFYSKKYETINYITYFSYISKQYRSVKY